MGSDSPKIDFPRFDPDLAYRQLLDAVDMQLGSMTLPPGERKAAVARITRWAVNLLQTHSEIADNAIQQIAEIRMRPTTDYGRVAVMAAIGATCGYIVGRALAECIAIIAGALQ